MTNRAVRIIPQNLNRIPPCAATIFTRFQALQSRIAAEFARWSTLRYPAKINPHSVAYARIEAKLGGFRKCLKHKRKFRGARPHHRAREAPCRAGFLAAGGVVAVLLDISVIPRSRPFWRICCSTPGAAAGAFRGIFLAECRSATFLTKIALGGPPRFPGNPSRVSAL
jgi:hypothetical protein